jgi:hypothetical protein
MENLLYGPAILAFLGFVYFAVMVVVYSDD